MTPAESAAPNWIEIRPSNVNLALTLLVPLCAMAVLFLIELPDWLLAVLCTGLFLVTIADVYMVRQLSSGAVSAFRLFTPPESFATGDMGGSEGDKSPRTSPQALGIRVRYRHPAKRGGVAEAEGVLGPRAYVSTYFTSFSYRLHGDPVWRRWFPRVISLWADGVDREAFRQVRVQLKWR